MPLSYVDTVLSKLPYAFYQCKELFGPVMADSSGNSYDGVYASGVVFGLPSPIETDADSHAIRGSGSSSVAPFPLNNFSWGGWGLEPDGGVATIVARSGQPGVGVGSNFIAFDAGTIGVRVTLRDIPGEFFDLSYAVPVRNVFYRVLVTRNGPVLSLYVNAVLVAQRSDLPNVAFSHPGVTGNWWKVGVSGDFAGNVFGGVGTCMVDLYDYPLIAGDELEIYESALLQIRLLGRSDVVVSAALSSLIEPVPISFPWRHNWDTPLIERLAFRTAVSSARTVAEEANSQRVAPRREFEFTQVLKLHTERRKLRAQLWANQNRKWMFPVRQDAEQLSVAALAGATSVPMDTRYKDYEVGGYVGLRQLDDSGAILHWEERLISEVLVNGISCEPLAYDYDARTSLAYPVRRVLLPRSQTVKGHTDSVEELTVTAQLLPEDEALIPRRIIPWHPSLKYRDHEVFDISVWPSNDWSDTHEYEVSRETDEIDFGVGLMGLDSDTAGAAETIPWRIKVKGREIIARFLGWFYERRGRWRYVWVPTLQADFEVLSVLGNELTVADTNYSDNFALAEPRRDLAFVYNDLSMEFRRVVGFRGTVNEVLELDASVPSLVNLRSVSLLKFCRLDGDQIEIAWHTDDVVEIAWAFREMLHSPEGVGASSLSPSASISVSLSPSASTSPSSSVSLSRSPSPSVSPSGSASPSASVSASPSASTSSSPSASTSASISPSSSESPSQSRSLSPSPSTSPSHSTSPSV
jgi:hypothetical protein